MSTSAILILKIRIVSPIIGKCLFSGYHMIMICVCSFLSNHDPFVVFLITIADIELSMGRFTLTQTMATIQSQIIGYRVRKMEVEWEFLGAALLVQ